MSMRPARSALFLVAVLALGGCSRSATELVASGDAYVAEGKLREAIVEYRNAIQTNPRLGDARLKLARVFEQVNEPTNAAAEYVRAADLLPTNADAQISAGQYLLLSGQFEDARSRAEKALALDRASVDAQILKASAMANMKDLDGAIRQLEEAIRITPPDVRMHESLGLVEMARGNQAEAEAAFRRAVELDPRSVSSHLALGIFLASTNRPAEAERSIKEALDRDPQNLLANRALAMFYLTSNRAAEAETPLKAIAQAMTDGSGALALSDYYVQMRRLADAHLVLDQIKDDEALFSEVRRRRASLLYAEKKSAEAKAVLDEVLARNGKDADALLMRARFQQLEGQRDEAMKSARAAIAADANHAAAHHLVGELEAARGRVDEAIASFNEVLRLNPRVVSAQIELARLNLAKVGGAEASVSYAEQALANQPGNPNAQLVLVRGLLARGDVARAERETESLLKGFQNSALVQSQMGTVQLVKKDMTSARRYFDRALQIDPNLLQALGGLTSLDLAARRFDAAKARVDAKLAEHPSSPDFIELAARTAMSSNDAATAERHLQRLIQVAPDRLSGYGLLVQVYLRQRRLNEARAELERLASKQDTPVGPHTLIGMLYEQEGRADEARKMYEQVLRYDSRAAVAANNLAWMMAERNENLDLALKYAQTAKAVSPDVPEISDTLAWVYYKKDLAPLAVEPLQHAVSRDPKNANYHYRLGLVYLKTGDVAKAKRSLEQALSIDPAFPGAADARAKLSTL
jgi:tetratricopeptide (TPR) repeat protein